jgi:membrane protein DedA with SNARE-associated domain
VDTATRLNAWLAAAVAATGPYAPALLFGAAFIEYVFPPFPGDMVVLLGAWYAVQGQLSWPLAFLAVTAGSVAGALVDHRLGVLLGRGLAHGWADRLGLNPDRLARFEASYRRWGALLLVANRFLPGVRAFLFVAAGASGVPARAVLVYGGLSAVLWNAGLLAAGAYLAHSLEELIALLRSYTQVAWIVLGAAALLATLVWLRRRMARPGPEVR